MTSATQNSDRLIRLPEVTRQTGRSRSCIYRGVNSGTFPEQVKIGRAVAWSEREILRWIEARKDERHAVQRQQ